MNSLENLYLMFQTGEIYFLLPLEAVEKVQDRQQAGGDLPCLDLFGISGEKIRERNQKYVVCVSVRGKVYGILADEVRGIREVDETAWMILEEPVVSERNRYLKAVVQLVEESEIPVFVVDVEILGERIFKKISDVETRRFDGEY